MLQHQQSARAGWDVLGRGLPCLPAFCRIASRKSLENRGSGSTNPLPSTITLAKTLPGLVLIALLGAGCATASSSVTPSASVTTLMWGWERHFSLEWTVESEKGGGRRLSGYVYNHHGEFALSVRLLAQALDPVGAVVGHRIEWVSQGVGGFGRTYFEVPHLPPSDNYRVTVWEYTWLQSDGDKR